MALRTAGGMTFHGGLASTLVRDTYCTPMTIDAAIEDDTPTFLPTQNSGTTVSGRPRSSMAHR